VQLSLPIRALERAGVYPPGVVLVVDVPAGVVLVVVPAIGLEVVGVVDVGLEVAEGVVLVLVDVVPLGVVGLEVLEGGAGTVDGVDVVGAGVVVDDVGDDVVEVLLELGGLVSSPLFCSAESISCCTVVTSAATAAGVPAAPSAGSAFSCLRSAFSVSRSCWEGWDLSVTTIWSARAVVIQAGQL
jgi:hypothetical protein